MGRIKSGGGGIAASEAPHRQLQPWEAMGRRLMEPSSSVGGAAWFEDEAARDPCSHLLGGRHQRPWVGGHVQQVGWRHPWQGRVQVRSQDISKAKVNYGQLVKALPVDFGFTN